MEITGFLIIGVISCFLSVLLSQYKPEFALLIKLCAVAVISLMLIDYVGQLFSLTNELNVEAKINKEYIYLLVKAVVIAVCGKVVCDICTDCGNKAVATCIDLACRVSIMLLVFPMLKVLLQLTTDLIKE